MEEAVVETEEAVTNVINYVYECCCSDYTGQLDSVLSELQESDYLLEQLWQELQKANEYISFVSDCMELVNIFLYILIACIVCFFGYKIFSWFF